MSNGGNLEFVLEIDSRDFNVKIKDAGNLIDTLNNKATKGANSNKSYQQSFNSLGGSVTNFVTTLGLLQSAIRTVYDLTVGWQTKIIQIAADMERTRVMLEGMAKSADRAAEAQQNMNYIIDKAKNAPFSIDAITDSFVKLKSAGIDPTNGSMNALIDGVARFGGNNDIMKRATIALQQMAGKGVVSMEELRQQLGEAIPTAMRNMADAMGVTLSTLTKRVSQGTVEAQNAINVMLAEMHLRYGGAAEQLMKTVSGTLSQVETAFIVLADKLGKAGYNDLAKSILTDFKNALNSPEVEAFAIDFLNAMQSVVSGLKDMLGWIMENRYAIAEVGKALLIAFAASATFNAIKGVIGLFGGLYNAIKPIGTAMAAVTTALTSFVSSSAKVGVASAAMTSFGGAINGAIASWKALDLAVKFSVIGTVLTVIAGIAYTCYKAFGDVDGKLADIIKRGKQLPGSLGDNEIEKLKKSSEDASKKLQVLERDLKEFQKAKDKNQKFVVTDFTYVGDYTAVPVYQDTTQALEDRKKQELETQQQIEQAKAVISANAREIEKRATAQHYDHLLELGRDSLSALRKSYNDYEDGINQKRMDIENNPSLNLEQKELARTELSKEQQQKRLELAEAEQKVYADLVKKAEEQAEAGKEALKTLDPQSEAYGQIEGQIAAATNKAYEYSEQLREITRLVTTIKTGLSMGILNIDGLFTKDGQNSYLADAQKLFSQYEKAAAKARSKGSKWFDNSQIGGRNEQLLADRINATLDKMGMKYEDVAKSNDKVNVQMIKLWEGARKNAILADKATEHTGSGVSKLTSQYNKAVNAMNSADQLLEKMSMHSTEVVKFDQEVSKLRASLTKLANATPNGKTDKDGNILGVTNEQIQTAKQQLKELDENLAEYRTNLVKTSTMNAISTKIPFANQIIQNVEKTTAELKKEFDEQYALADAAFKKLIDSYAEDSEQRKVAEEAYQLFLRGKLNAQVEMTGTACEKMIKSYQEVAKSIDNYFSDAFDNLGDKLTDFITTGKADWEDFSNYLYAEFMRMVVKSQFIAPLMQALGLGSDATANGGGWFSNLGALFNLNSNQQPQQAQQNTNTSGASNATGAVAGAVGAVAGAANSDKEKGIFESIGNMFSSFGKKLNDMWDSLSTGFSNFFSNMGSSASGMWDSITGMAGDVWNAIGDGFSTVIDFIGKGFSSIMNALGGAGSSVWSSISSGLSSMFSVTPNANGGIMTSAGPLPLKAYSKGGIANKPQLALFGEGRMNEAYVPLPDGRSIPVSFKDGFSNASSSFITNTTNIESKDGNSNIEINISVVNSTEGSDETTTSSGEDGNENARWKDMASKVKSLVQQEISVQKRSNGQLSPRNMRG